MMFKKTLLAASLIAVIGSASADCKHLPGIWTGTYTNANGQTSNATFYLQYNQSTGWVTGYTELNGGPGSNPNNHYALWAKCSNSVMTNMQFARFIPSANQNGTPTVPCSQAKDFKAGMSQTVYTANSGTLALQLPFNGSTLPVNLTLQNPQNLSNPHNAQAPNQSLYNQVASYVSNNPSPLGIQNCTPAS